MSYLCNLILNNQLEEVSKEESIHPSFILDAPSVEMAELLCSKGLSLKYMNKERWTLLHTTASVPLARFLLSKGLDINAQTVCGNTPLLFYTHRRQSTLLAQFAIDAGADINHINAFNYTAVDYAFGDDLITLLIEHGSDLPKDWNDNTVGQRSFALQIVGNVFFV